MYASTTKLPVNSIDLIQPCLFKRKASPNVAEHGLHIEGSKKGKPYVIILDLNFAIVSGKVIQDYMVGSSFAFPVPSPIGLLGRKQ